MLTNTVIVILYNHVMNDDSVMCMACCWRLCSVFFTIIDTFSEHIYCRPLVCSLSVAFLVYFSETLIICRCGFHNTDMRERELMPSFSNEG